VKKSANRRNRRHPDLSVVVLLAASLSGCAHAGGMEPSHVAPAPTAHVGGLPAASSAVLTVDRPALYPETLVYDPRHRAFLVGSLREGAVYRVDDAGKVTRLVDDARLSSVLGIAVDPARNRLWVTNSDLGVSLRPSATGPKSVAAVAIYELSTGKALRYVDLASLLPAPHLINGIALDGDGRAYVTDSFSPAIYALELDGSARVLLQDEAFAGAGINLNGVVVHPDGYLLVIKKSDGALFKVPLDHPEQFSKVASSRALLGGDGLLLTSKKDLLVIANEVPALAANAAYVLSSEDGFRSAVAGRERALGDVYPTTAALRDGSIFVLHTKLDELLQAPRERLGELREQATIEELGSVAAITSSSADGQIALGASEAPAPVAPGAGQEVRRTLLAQRELVDRPGWESRLYLVDFPPAASSPLHVHPVQCVGYVLEGSFESRFGDEPASIKHAGESFVDLADAPHQFRNVDSARPLRFLIAGSFPKGAPLFQPLAR